MLAFITKVSLIGRFLLRLRELQAGGLSKRRNGRSVACVARYRSGFIEKHQSTFHRLFDCVASGTGYIFVSTLQREGCLVVIEQRWFPLIRVVARLALVLSRSELVRMRIFMAICALHRGLSEIDVAHVEFHCRRLMAVHAGYGAMRTGKLELCC